VKPIEQVLATLRQPQDRGEAVAQAAGREPLLHRLGQLYRERFAAGGSAADPAVRWEVYDLETKLGMTAGDGPAEPPGAPADQDWRSYVLHGLLAGARTQPQPEAVLVLEQPGAGKGVITEELSRHFGGRGGSVVVDVNELQYLHPDPAALAPALRSAAVAERKNLVLDSPCAGAESATALVPGLHDAGYRITAIVLCVPPEESWQSARDHCNKQRAPLGVGRGVDREAHDGAVRGLRICLRALEGQGLLDELHVVTRDGRCLLSAAKAKGLVPGAAERALDGRAEPPAAEKGDPGKGGSPPGKRAIRVGPVPAPGEPPPAAATAAAGDSPRPVGRGFRIGSPPAAPAPAAEGAGGTARREPPRATVKGFRLAAPAAPGPPAPPEEPREKTEAPEASRPKDTAPPATGALPGPRSPEEEEACIRRRMWQLKLRRKIGRMDD
jgi:hypothetical protein